MIGLINSGFACFYYLKLLASVYAKPDTTAQDQDASGFSAIPAISVPAGIGLTLTAAATLMLGILPGQILRLADQASGSLSMNPASDVTASSQADSQAHSGLGQSQTVRSNKGEAQTPQRSCVPACQLIGWKGAAEGRMVRPERFERPTYWFVASCSIQLSYGAHSVSCNRVGHNSP